VQRVAGKLNDASSILTVDSQRYQQTHPNLVIKEQQTAPCEKWAGLGLVSPKRGCLIFENSPLTLLVKREPLCCKIPHQDSYPMVILVVRDVDPHAGFVTSELACRETQRRTSDP